MGTTAATATNLELFTQADELIGTLNSTQGRLLEIVGEVDRRQAFREEGATSTAAWLAERVGLAESTARTWVQTAEQLYERPLVAEAITDGSLTLDKAKAALQLALFTDPAPDPLHPDDDDDDDDDATIEHPDKALLEQARHCTVHQLNEMVRAARGASAAREVASVEGRYLRCNDTRRTINMQLPDEQFALVRGVLNRTVATIPSDGTTPHDQRMADAMVQIVQRSVQGASTIRTAGAETLVVVHADLSLLRGGTGRAELERLGLISREAAKRISCDANVTLAIDDAFGHTMAEGRKKRLPSAAQRREVRRRDRNCRFPGCTNSMYTNVHHIVHWADGGKTDLDNLVTLCNFHHHRLHEQGWQMSGDPNGELKFLGPTKRLMTSRPSPLWTMRN
jgi:hypothetical protein